MRKTQSNSTLGHIRIFGSSAAATANSRGGREGGAHLNCTHSVGCGDKHREVALEGEEGDVWISLLLPIYSNNCQRIKTLHQQQEEERQIAVLMNRSSLAK